MSRNPLTEETTPRFDDVVGALDDPDCRAIVRHLDEPKSADDVADETGIPRSTAYQKLDDLRTAGLVEEFTGVRRDGHHTANYECSLDENREFRVLAVGFGVVILGDVVVGLLDLLAPASVEAVLVVESAPTAVGFGAVLYSLYRE